MLPLLRVQLLPPVSRTGTDYFFSEDTTGCAACCDLTLLGYVIYEYSMGFSHADRVFVIGDADCEPSTIYPKKGGAL